MKATTETKQTFKANIELQKKVLGDGHPDTVLNIDSLTYMYFRQGMVKKAEELRLVGVPRERREEWEATVAKPEREGKAKRAVTSCLRTR